MAGMTRRGLLDAEARSQYAAMAVMRWRIFVNGLHSIHGILDLGATGSAWLFYAVFGLGTGFGLAAGGYALAQHARWQFLPILFWATTLLWLMLPVAVASYQEQSSLGILLRFPVRFGSYFALHLISGLMEASTIVGSLCCLGIWLGIVLVCPQMAGPLAAVLVIFAAFNILLVRAVFAWIERWLAQRRTREIVTGVFLVLALAAQVLNPAFHQNYRSHVYRAKWQTVQRVVNRVWGAQQIFPPGLATNAISGAIDRNELKAAGSFLALGLYTLGAAGLLTIRLRAESRGENLSEAPRRPATAKARSQLPRRSFLDFSGPIAAVFEKDLRYLLRSGPMLYNLAVPLVMVIVFGGATRAGQFSGIRLTYALPIGMIWAFLGLTRLISNNLGAEGEGIQFFFLAPTPMRTVILGKNLLHLTLFLLEAVAITAIVVVRFGAPEPSIVAATLAWILFAVPANLATGNLLSIRMPYRVNLARIRREPGAVGNSLTSMVAQFAMIAVGAVVLGGSAFLGHPWVAVPILLLLAAFSTLAYARILSGVDRMVEARRDALTLEVMKAA